ncbi:MAG: teichoic acid biosynthesis protein [Spirochaetes bacterium]|nr:teichoic acid biosynthesis protein [Spirochaetota bacterium]
MKTIFYSMAGEGRGHATRVRGLIEDLKKDNRIILYAPDQAYDLLEPVYNSSDVLVKKIPGLHWAYDKNKKLNYAASVTNALRYIKELPGVVKHLSRDIDHYNPDLIISDFDPALPRAAKQCGRSFISFDHQHFLTAYDLGALPLHLRSKASFMAPAVDLIYTGQEDTIVSSFYFPPLKKGYKNIKQIGVLINKEITEITPEHGDYLTVYLRRFASRSLIKALSGCGYPVKVYGLGKLKNMRNIEFCEIDFFRFIEDLAGAKALMTTAGNQVVGEALYLNKPVLAIPEPGNFEQEINAYFLKDTGAGEMTDMENITTQSLKEFLNLSEVYRKNINSRRVCGNNDAVRIINSHLNKSDAHQFQIPRTVLNSTGAGAAI